MNKVVKHYINFIRGGGKIPKMFNPYNETEITTIAPTLTTGCGSWDKSSVVLIRVDDYDNKDR